MGIFCGAEIAIELAHESIVKIAMEISNDMALETVIEIIIAITIETIVKGNSCISTNQNRHRNS